MVMGGHPFRQRSSIQFSYSLSAASIDLLTLPKNRAHRRLRSLVRGRRGPTANPDPDHPEYRELELDEINQFRRALFGLMHQDDAVEPKRTIELVHWSETPLPQ